MEKTFRNEGYTLIELLVVIGILALVAAVATPVASAVVQSARARSDDYTVMSSLRRCQGDAIAQQKTITVRTKGDLIAATGMDQSELTTETTIEIASPLMYFPDGTTSGGQVIVHHGLRATHLSVAWLTGAISRETQ